LFVLGLLNGWPVGAVGGPRQDSIAVRYWYVRRSQCLGVGRPRSQIRDVDADPLRNAERLEDENAPVDGPIPDGYGIAPI
jgi:hypothetical protein